jgi:hypothetical protein
VVKLFPSRIVTEGPSRVNGKSVPFAHLRKVSGFPEQCARLNKLFPRLSTCNNITIRGLIASYATPSGIPDALSRTSSLVLSQRDHLKIDLHKKGQLVETSSTRRSPRIRLQVPVFLRATDVSGAEFIELTKTLNISSTGACIVSTHILRPEQTVHLTIPTPGPATSSMVPSETPPIVARVLRQESSGEMRLFGLEFLRPLE